MDMEQISHHPPVSLFQCKDDNNKWQFYGYNKTEVVTSINSASATNYGDSYIVLSNENNDNDKYHIKFPVLNILGTAFGERRIIYSGTSKLTDYNNNLEIEIT